MDYQLLLSLLIDPLTIFSINQIVVEKMLIIMTSSNVLFCPQPKNNLLSDRAAPNDYFLMINLLFNLIIMFFF